MFGSGGGQQFLMAQKWLSATSHPLGMNVTLIRGQYSVIQNVIASPEH